MTKILVANVWTDKNIGDRLIIYTTVKLLREKFPNAYIVGMTMFGSDQQDLIQEEIGPSAKLFDKIVGAPLPTSFIYRKEKGWHNSPAFLYVKWLFWVMCALCILLIVKIGGFKILLRCLPEKFRETYQVLSQVDLIVIRGGGYLKSDGLYDDISVLFRHMFPAFLALAMRKKYALISHSFWGQKGPFTKVILNVAIRNSLVTTVRDFESKEWLLSIGIPSEKIKVFPDIVYTFNPKEVVDESSSRKYKTVSIVLRRWLFPRETDPKKRKALIDSYNKNISNLIEELAIDEKIEEIILVPQTFGEIEGDDIFEKKIASKLSLKARRKVKLTPLNIEDPLPTILKLYSRSEFIISCRFHASLLAALLGVPSITIALEGPKYKAFGKMLNLERFVIPVESFDAKKVMDLSKELLAKREQISSLIKERIPILSVEARKHIEVLLI